MVVPGAHTMQIQFRFLGFEHSYRLGACR